MTHALIRIGIGAYFLLFFAYLFGPLIIMSVTAFNSSSFPLIYPWECFTFEWFDRLAADTRIKLGLWNTIVIGIPVVFLSVAIGLAGALLLSQIFPRARAVYYIIVTSPILMPGIVIGIATVLFWRQVTSRLGMDSDNILQNGVFLTVLAQSSFIASYCMLVFFARLQRFDDSQMEAALDLGATNVQAFRKILLPFLRPAILSAAIIAFLASFENYNTSVFTIKQYTTFTIEIAQRVRLGLNPSISALAVIIIAITLFFALVNHAIATKARQTPGGSIAFLKTGITGFFVNNPAAVIALLFLAGVASLVFVATRYDAEACTARVLERKLERQRQFSVPRADQRQQPVVPGQANPGSQQNPGKGSFGNIFENLPQPESGAPPPQSPPPPAKPNSNPGKDSFGDIFSPDNLPAPAPQPEQ
jgi:spermidine/putrescine transport system permease protein